jgi:hypothetical protein
VEKGLDNLLLLDAGSCLQGESLFDGQLISLRQEVIEAVLAFLHSGTYPGSLIQVNRTFLFRSRTEMEELPPSLCWKGFKPEFVDVADQEVVLGIDRGQDLHRLPACLFHREESRPQDWLVSDECLLQQMEAAFHRFDRASTAMTLRCFPFLSLADRVLLEREVALFDRNLVINNREDHHSR